MAIAKKKIALIGLLIIAGVLAIIRFVLMNPKAQEELEEVKSGNSETLNQIQDVLPGKENKMMGQEQSMMDQGMMGQKAVTVTTNYTNPGGSDDVSFTLVVDNEGVITKAETGVLAKNPTSKMRQESFAAALPAVLVGKKLSEVNNVDRVGGSSLTTKAFNDSLLRLKSQI